MGLSAKGREFVQKERQSKRVHQRVLKYFDVPRAEARKMTPGVVKIQRAWRRHRWVTRFNMRAKARWQSNMHRNTGCGGSRREDGGVGLGELRRSIVFARGDSID